MATVTISAGAVGAMLRAAKGKNEAAITRGLKLAAQRIAGYLKGISPVDMGRFKNAWRSGSIGPRAGVLVFNDAPYAGIIEKGARPHAVSPDGIEAIARWAERHGMGDGKPSQIPGVSRGAMGAAWAIAAKLREKGQPGLRLVEDNIPKFLGFLQAELERELQRGV